NDPQKGRVSPYIKGESISIYLLERKSKSLEEYKQLRGSAAAAAMQGGSSGIGYGLKYQARCISDVKADTDHTSFITGTLSLKEENEVHLIRLSSDGTELVCEGLFSHPNEIWDLASCPFDQRIFSTVYSTGESYGAAIWQIPELYGELNSPQLERITSLDSQVGKIKCILWWPSGRHDKLISIDEENLSLWSLDLSRKAAQVQSQESAGVMHYLSGGAWDPHDMNAVAATCESSIQFWDLRTMKKTNSVEHAHVRNVDYNPKKKHVLKMNLGYAYGILGSQRSLSRSFLDTHTGNYFVYCCILVSSTMFLLDEPLCISDVAVRYNPEYDGLILSSGTDSTVNLWLASPSSNDGSISESLVDSPTRRIDPLLNSYSDYEDSIYGLAWSSREPWIFASLSYDGRVVVESVKPFLSRK
ncbi:Transducin/WD40 repeat-like superfamily protein, partial [Prunus dulcis]